MILILSTPRDNDTQIVVDWLVHKKADFFRLNDEDIMSGEVTLEMNPNDLQSASIKWKDRVYKLIDFDVVWLRKFGFFKSYEDTFGKKSDLTQYIYGEFSVIRSLIIRLLNDKKWLYKRTNMPTKLEVLAEAAVCGLHTPATRIISTKKALTTFFEQNDKRIISKSVGDGKHINYDNKNYPFYTQIIASLDGVTESFSPSLFQQYIDKKYELRVFYLDGSFYSMAIFSQNNERTKIDFRNYDFDHPNRLSRYQLTRTVEEKLHTLMQNLGLNTGSIDLIRATDDNYYFLEVNPAGQFGMTGHPCNYNLHEKIAEYLVNKDTAA